MFPPIFRLGLGCIIRAYLPLNVADVHMSILRSFPSFLPTFSNISLSYNSVGNCSKRTHIAVKDNVTSCGTNFGFHFLTKRKFPNKNQGPWCSALIAFSSFPNLAIKKSQPRSIKISSSKWFHRSISLERRK